MAKGRKRIDAKAFLADLRAKGIAYTEGPVADRPRRHWNRPPGVHGGCEYRVEFSTDIVTVVSEMNARVHWAVRRKRRKAQVDGIFVMLLPFDPPGPEHPDRYRITLTRYGRSDGPGRGRDWLDDDNLRSAFKGIRDYLAEWLGYDDGDARLTWVYKQAKCKPGVGVLIEGRP